MSISMIDSIEFPSSAVARGGELEMIVSGPLTLDGESRYVPPVTIKFVLIQGPERTPGVDAGHDPDEDQRVRGVVNLDPITDRWQATVSIDKTKFRAGEARGVAMAVMEKAGEYAYETLTWCDFVKLPELEAGESSKLVFLDADGAVARGVTQGRRKWETSSDGSSSAT